MGRKGALILALVIIGLVVFFALMILPKTGFAIAQDEIINANYLENLKQNAQVECLQNSQCAEGFECINNVCISQKEIDLCKSVNLYTPTRKLVYGSRINLVRRVLTKDELPHLLSDGELVEIVDGKTVEYFYKSIILIGDNKIGKENGDYVIGNDKPPYTYQLTFSNPVDFSDKNLQGQVLKILGEEYIINGDSDNSIIDLASDKKSVRLEEKKNAKIYKDENGDVVRIEIPFNSLMNIQSDGGFSDPLFNSVKLSFKQTNDNFADVKVGGAC